MFIHLFLLKTVKFQFFSHFGHYLAKTFLRHKLGFRQVGYFCDYGLWTQLMFITEDGHLWLKFYLFAIFLGICQGCSGIT